MSEIIVVIMTGLLTQNGLEQDVWSKAASRKDFVHVKFFGSARSSTLLPSPSHDIALVFLNINVLEVNVLRAPGPPYSFWHEVWTLKYVFK